MKRTLFEPLEVGGLQLAGRMVKSATVETRCTADGYVTDSLVQYYEEIAAGGTPLLITGAASYDIYSRGVPHQLSLDADDKVEGLTQLTRAVHQHGAKIMAQIYHTGRQALPGPVGRSDAQAPSAVYEPSLGVRPRAMTVEEIHATVKRFADAAERCKRAGFDGVQIHAAHGYLISAFLTPHTNRRQDTYGGSLENRMRILIEIYRAVRARVGPEYAIILKLNGSDELPLRKGLAPEELVEVAKRMEQEGVAAVEVSSGHYESGLTFSRAHWNGFFGTMMKEGSGVTQAWYRRLLFILCAPIATWIFNRIAGFSKGYNLSYAQQFKAALNIPVISVGGLSDIESIEKALKGGQCDMIAVARPLIADPYLYRHLREGTEGPRCNYCNGCLARAGVQPIDCYEPTVKKKRDAMMRP